MFLQLQGTARIQLYNGAFGEDSSNASTIQASPVRCEGHRSVDRESILGSLHYHFSFSLIVHSAQRCDTLWKLSHQDSDARGFELSERDYW